mmetsp:Transcript_50215/g.115916  ORF Transcript_50215/g.115916 Transcript_50215/m.115916 type:complete len:281 (-) Transcript_50215:112-954(-)
MLRPSVGASDVPTETLMHPAHGAVTSSTSCLLTIAHASTYAGAQEAGSRTCTCMRPPLGPALPLAPPPVHDQEPQHSLARLSDASNPTCCTQAQPPPPRELSGLLLSGLLPELHPLVEGPASLSLHPRLSLHGESRSARSHSLGATTSELHWPTREDAFWPRAEREDRAVSSCARLVSPSSQRYDDIEPPCTVRRCVCHANVAHKTAGLPGIEPQRPSPHGVSKAPLTPPSSNPKRAREVPHSQKEPRINKLTAEPACGPGRTAIAGASCPQSLDMRGTS